MNVIFDYDIWGTVSDWVMVFVTAVTGGLIYKTLDSQLKVQEVQQNQLKIVQRKFTKENAPKFNLEIIGFSPSFHKDVFSTGDTSISSFYYEIGLKFTLNTNVARNVKFMPSLPIEIELSEENIKNTYEHDFINVNDSITLHYIVRGSCIVIYSENPLHNRTLVIQHKLTFTINFEDELGNQFVQTIYQDISADDRNINAFKDANVGEPIVLSSIY